MLSILFMYNYNGILFLIRYSLCILFLYPLLHLFFSFNEKYVSHTYNKKCYILKNLIKSFVLCIISVTSIYDIFIPMYYDIWDNNVINKYGSMYVANDFLSLLIIPKLPKTTKFHHITTTILLFFSFSIDFKEDNVGRWIFVYCCLSSYSFLVNTYLGIRHLLDKNEVFIRFVDDLRIVAYYLYLVCCAINWSLHLYLFISRAYNFNLDYTHFIYMALLYPIINDDLILLSWLKKNDKY